MRRGPTDDEPIAAELFSVERLEQYAAELAVAQEVGSGPSRGVSLHRRLLDNAAVLRQAYQSMVAGIGAARAFTPAATWFTDNFYIVDEHIRAVRRDLPPEYYRQLPKLARGEQRGFPRVYGLGGGLIAHTDSRFEEDTLERFVRAYQAVQPLRIGELWAIAITLRIILIENLRRLAAGIVHRRALRAEADVLANRLLDEGTVDAGGQGAILRAYESHELPNAFAAALFQRLRDHDPATTPALAWLHSRLAALGTTADEVVHAEHQRQGSANVSVRNVITSLRLISSVDWPDFVERVSLVDAEMRGAGNFAALDFATRDRYRHRIEDLARGCRLTEIEVARAALTLAGRAPAQSPRRLDPGFYLVAEGRAELERMLGYRSPWAGWMGRAMRRWGLGGYVAGIAVVCVAFLVAMPHGFGGWWTGLAGWLCAALVSSDSAVTLVNLWVMRCCPAAILPALELVDGVPAELRTVIAVPALLTTPAATAELVRSLEVHFLASGPGDLRFALLSDWTDAGSEAVEGDQELLAAAVSGVARLNARYGAIAGEDRFVLLHRRRQWNARQGVWMGWERKRGKLTEFNRLLRGATDTSFITTASGRSAPPRAVRYVVVLDADTRLPHDAVRMLIGKMAHPLNRPQLDKAGRRVILGYGILQPRVSPSLPVGREGTVFQAIYSGRGGIDPYAFAVSDVYQDLFDEGSFSGKGIYDVDAFEAALQGRVPENTLLSHDLFEGVFARCGLASDIEVVEEHPAQYNVSNARQHRWTRGDWQLLPWVIGMRPGVPALGRWKMFDNLRRSLVAPAAVVLLLMVAAGAAHPSWAAFVALALTLPAFMSVILGFTPSNLRAFAGDMRHAGALAALRLILLADHAWKMADAILRTGYRLMISRRRLLEWRTAAQAKSTLASDLASIYRGMAGGVLIGIAGLLLVAATSRQGSAFAATGFLVWVAAPMLAWFMSQPAAARRARPLSDPQRTRLRRMGRLTWHFFETFVTARHHMLPPDNFQETPDPVVANRTSPTNIGLYLLSIVAAREFGWIGTREAVDRLEATFATLELLERHRGHFYNWYDTHDLRPLDPRYISTVDSGNLAGHLLALCGSCQDWLRQPLLGAMWQSGVEDTVALTRDCLQTLADERRNYGVSPKHLHAALVVLQDATSRRDGDALEHLRKWLVQADGLCDLGRALIDERGEGANAPLLRWSEALRANIAMHIRDLDEGAAADLHSRLATLAGRARDLALGMEFGFLLDEKKELLSIGWRVADRSQDQSCYDLLASEARLASFIGIAKGDLPVRHWFRLGRLLTPVRRGLALVSWSGSMFEYLMAELVMRDPPGSLLGDTARLTVQRQIDYGLERRLPWGVSESAFNARDVEFTYQYSSFGVPGLGLQRGLGDEAVVAPYATGLAAMIDAPAALENFETMAELGAQGSYGWYEALDFTPSRVPEGSRQVSVRAYMAHHQGMMLVAVTNVLHDGIFQARFHAQPLVQASELLLQERTPRDAGGPAPRAEELESAEFAVENQAPVPRRFTSPHHVAPRTHLLSNGNYSVMVTVAGSGYSRWRDVALTRWREDPTCDPWGSYVYLRDVSNGEVWSAGYQPVGTEAEQYAAAFYEDRAELTRHDGRIVTSTEIMVSPEDDAEVRRVSVTNHDSRVREIELTSYMELVLATASADSAHPAFSKLFVETEFHAAAGALLAHRRGRRGDADPIWLAHVSSLDGEAVGALQYESDRAKFIGRGRSLREPVSVLDARPLSNTVGTVLDPVFALRRRVRIAPGATATAAFWTIVAGDRNHALALADKYRDPAAFERVKTLSWTQAQVQLRYLGVDYDEAQQFQRIANRVLYADASLRAPREFLVSNRLGQPSLWSNGISGDLPIVLIRVDDEHDMSIVKQLLRAHAYWMSKRLAVDLVILNDRPPSYASDLQHEIEAAIRTARSSVRDEDAPGLGRVFLLRSDSITVADRDFLQTAARAILIARLGSLSDQLARLREADPAPRPRVAAAREPERPELRKDLPPLEFFNGLGGFAADGHEYLVTVDGGHWTPAPWTNVIANPRFGFQVSADGMGSTWSENSRENQLTPWSNDPVSNAPAEVVYLQDLDSGEFWSATPLPVREESPYVTRHGFGYSSCEHSSHGIALELTQFVPREDPVKIARLRITNHSPLRRHVGVTHYLEWVLGQQRGRSGDFLITEINPRTGALFARNPWNRGFESRVAFMDMSGRQQSVTGNRAEFLGRHGSMAEPASLIACQPLSNRVGAGFDPCGAMQVQQRLAPGETIELVLLLGEGASVEEAAALVEKYRRADVEEILRSVRLFWSETLFKLRVRTPDRSLDLMVGGWLLYQTLVCRLWARCGFYQASGAYGYRDQLQDVMALCVARPQIAREHILRAASRQFDAGDVQHWWLPSSGQGVQTRVSDDRLWLPFVTAHYCSVTRDTGLLDQGATFLQGPPLRADQPESFDSPPASAHEASVFEHCARALDSSMNIGSHGLPLFGAGDWNDGMNRVGVEGRGESVWLAWFLHATLLAFAPLAEARGESLRAAAWRKHANTVLQAIEREAWDGDWYRRGYFDDGTPLGSVSGEECRIDAIAQSWAVIAGGGDPGRAARAMAAVNAQLVSRSDGLVKLFTPAFDLTPHDPGYIRDYPPGIRENGGQYTHAAMWTTLAFALMGEGDLAGELFSLLNPVNHASTRAAIHRYKVEPYVACADVYCAPAHVGRGGWTWYTGSAGWMYRTAVEGMLGCLVSGATMRLQPCIPRGWGQFELTYLFGQTTYHVTVLNPAGVNRGVRDIAVDAVPQAAGATEIALLDDGRVHEVRVTLG